MNKTILITGANRGIGKAVALGLAADGYDIAVHCRSRRDEAEAVAAEICAQGRQARVLQFDVGDRAACREILSADVAAHGAYYGVVLNAGLTRDNAFPALEDEDWDNVLRTNLDGFYNVLHPVIMPMIRRRQPGRIVCMASAPGLIDTAILDEHTPVAEILKMIPAQRMGSPEEVAHAVRFLMDEKAAYITRQVISVNGGLC